MDKTEELLTRGVANIIPNRETLEKTLSSSTKLNIYFGIDPTSPFLHLGHMVGLKKLRHFQDLGHEVIVLIGDFTARIGDPTGKLSIRHKLTKEQIEENTVNYKNLIGKILDLKKANVRFLHNEEWSNKLKPENLLELASYFTVSQLLERDMFQERIKKGKEIYVHEFLYPIFQAYDSVTMDVDLEIGGNDQTFNMLAGRTLVKKLKHKEKFILTTKLLTDPEGKKMGKTEGNIIKLNEIPTEIFGKVMALPDEIITLGFELLTDVPMEEVKTIEEAIERNENPMSFKKKLAFEIVSKLHGKEEAEKAQSYFETAFQKREIPEEVLGINVSDGILVNGLVETKIAESKSQAKRFIDEGSVYINNEKVTDPNHVLKSGDIIRRGREIRKVNIK